MYDELIKRLWACASGECFNCSQYTETTNASVCSKELMKQAADAIEELSKRVPPVPHGRLIDADALAVHKFAGAEHDISIEDGGACYRRGWNDAIEAIMENAETIIGGE